MRILHYMPVAFGAYLFVIPVACPQGKNEPAHSSNAIHTYQQGIEYYDHANWPEAALWWRQTIAADAQMQPAWYNLALAYFQMNDYLETELHLEKLFAINPFYDSAQKLYGMALYHRGEYARAIKAFNYAVNRAPATELLLARATSYIALGEPKYALTDFDEILYDDPGHIKACLGKSIALMELGKHTDALRFLNRILDNDPENVVALTNRAICHFQLGDHLKSDTDFEMAFSIEASTRVLLARASCQLANGQFSAALSDVKAAMSLDPIAPEIYYVLGEIELEQQKYTQAIESFRIAIDLDHTCKNCYLMKSEAEAYLSNFTDAVAGIYIVLDMAPNNEKAKEMLMWVYAKMDMERE